MGKRPRTQHGNEGLLAHMSMRVLQLLHDLMGGRLRVNLYGSKAGQRIGRVLCKGRQMRRQAQGKSREYEGGAPRALGGARVRECVLVLGASANAGHKHKASGAGTSVGCKARSARPCASALSCIAERKKKCARSCEGTTVCIAVRAGCLQTCAQAKTIEIPEETPIQSYDEPQYLIVSWRSL
ncbi:hypothetical protein H6P81_003742 [Aristolochia fimbriata]|uniref:Uncharacterized protein n=1 Tax=Aristolochia fimbriata TaxID=158543 RepID=A0AAV7FFF1_ARIFI|nr:hypothetical protein H6P81_003742 [Aristolochia fimbriata]